ncbi:MerR-like transcriptional regulator [Gordonia phage GMA6]|uniref:HTH merR-type domain-containing protein n=1 Tax=Gordonia phage GMA6 TaxID=1647285 RepID=A0A0K0NKT8_9CAUD|nr:MerR-like transcriptional regulator [Gordonia phage GMA6]AKL88350.1 hypothetical protein GMA6_69 [Gordonia phage GMA6]
MEATGFMSQIPEGWFTRSQVAARIGKSVDTIRRWHASGIYKSTRQEQFGSVNVWLYSEEDVAAMKHIARTIRPGRVAKED